MNQRLLLVASSAASTLLAALFFSSAALADKGAAVALFDEAERLASAGRVADACPKYEESYRLDPQLGALMHLADCQEQIGLTASAWGSFREAVELAHKQGDPRSELAATRAAVLEKRLSHLTVAVSDKARVPGLALRRDGEPVGPALWGAPVPVDPGEHTVEATAPGMKPWSTKITVAGDAQAPTLEVPPLEPQASPAGSAAAPGAAGGSAYAARPDPGATQRLIGWTVVGGGGVGLVLGLVFKLQESSTLSKRDDICPTNLNCTTDEATRIKQLTSDADSQATASTISFIAGGVLVAGGLAAVFTAPSGDVAFTPVLGPGFAGFSASRVW